MESIKIAIIDVKKTKASVLTDLLKGLSYSVIESPVSGEDCLALCQKERPRIIILGITGDGNAAGMKIIEKLRAVYQPLLIYCAEQFYRQAGENMLPSQGYLVPPFNAGQLSAILSRALEDGDARRSIMAEEKFRRIFMNNSEYCDQHDITDSDQLFNAYRDSERKYRNIFENAPMGIFQITSTGKVLTVNNKMASILGYDSPDETIEAFNDIGKKLDVDPDRRNEFLKLLDHDKAVVNFEYEAFKKDGTTVWISMNAHISGHNEDGSFYINGFSEDITARKKAHAIINMGISHMVLINELNSDLSKNAGTDEIIKKTCDRLKDIHNLRFADFYFKAVSSDSSEYLIYQYSNIQNVILNAVEKITGLSLQNIQIPLFEGSVYRELYENRIPMEFNGNEEVARSIRDFVPAEKKLLRALAGEVAQVAGNKYVYLAPLVVRGEAIGHVGFNREIPFSREEKESVAMVIDKLSSIFDKIRTDEALRSSLREKDMLLKEIHHRVKNNMQIISSLLALQSGFISDERDLELFADSQNRIRSMSLIHDQLYQSSSLSQIDFRSYTDRLVTEVLQSYNTGSKIDVDMDIIDTPLPINVAIPCALILNELLSNALKHAFPEKRGGRVHISFVKNHGHRYIFSINDNGIGFSGSLDTSSGKSLGMHLVSELTRQIGGTLTIQHKGGTSFIIEFSDLYEPPRDEKISCMEPRIDSEKLILIVEDDLITGNFLKKMLEKYGYKIPPVMVTGESAINFVRQCRPDLIIMDIMLGGPMDGVETARIIKEQYGIPVIFSSGSSEDATLTRVQKIRPAGFILKPIDKERLLSLIRQVLKK